MGVLVQPPQSAVTAPTAVRMADPPPQPDQPPGRPPHSATMTHQAPQLSPLSGAYCLIVVGEPFSEDHKKLILQKLQQGLNTWNINDNHVDIESELAVIADCAPPGEETRGGERLIQFATEHLVTEVLIHPQVNTLQQCMKNMLGSFTKHRHIIHAGYTFAGQGSWILQDGTFSFNEFATVFDEYDVQRVLRSYENSISIHVHCCERADWTQENISMQQFSKLCKIEMNPKPVIEESNAIEKFVAYLEPFLQPQSIQERLPPSDVVGNIRFSHPTLYVFPGGQGDSALFGINGFNMLIDGGVSRKACFWDFTRHLDRLDAILVTRLSDENTQGISAVLERKSAEPVYPQIGHFFANIIDTGAGQKEKYAEEEKDKLLVNVIHEGNSMIENLRILNLKPQICFRDNICDPINLYHKVGHGKLDMYVLNPSKESREVKEFLSRWSEDIGQLGNMKAGINVDGKELWLPIANLVSICALLIWQPANPNDTMTRLLFPGSTPQHKIFKGLEKLKKLECLKYPTCSSSTLQQAKTKSRKHKEYSMKKDANKERHEKIARLKQEKLLKANEEREKIEKERKEEKDRRDKERQEKIKEKDRTEKEKKEERERKDKERSEKEREEKERKEKLKKEKKEREKEKADREKAAKETVEREKRKKKEQEEMLLKQKKEEKEKKETERKERRERKEKAKKDAMLQKEKDEKEKANMGEAKNEKAAKETVER